MTKALAYVIETAERGFYDNTNKNMILESMNHFAKMKLQTIQEACTPDLVVAYGYLLGEFHIDCRNTYSMSYTDIAALLLEYPKSENREEYFAKYETTLKSFVLIARWFKELAGSNEYAETIYNTQIKTLYECLKHANNVRDLKYRYNQLLQYSKEKLDYEITDSTTVKSLCKFVEKQQLTESTQSTSLNYRGKQFAQILKFLFGDLFCAAFRDCFNVRNIQNRYPEFDEDADNEFFTYHVELCRNRN